jgi:hypothetical protein
VGGESISLAPKELLSPDQLGQIVPLVSLGQKEYTLWPSWIYLWRFGGWCVRGRSALLGRCLPITRAASMMTTAIAEWKVLPRNIDRFPNSLISSRESAPARTRRPPALPGIL